MNRVRLVTTASALTIGLFTTVLFQNCGKYKANSLSSSSTDMTVPLALDPADPLNANVQDSNLIQTQNAVISIVLNKSDVDPIVVSYQTSDGTAKTGINYQQSASSVTIPSGQTSVNVMVPVISADPVNDLNFNLTITAVSKGAIGRAVGKFTIAKNVVVKPTWHLHNPGTVRAGYQMQLDAWTGAKLIRFFEYEVAAPIGVTPGYALKGFQLDPMTGVSIAMPDAPLSPRRPYMTYAGNKLVVWGGNYAVNDGAMYNPATNTWTAMSAAGAPSARGEGVDVKVIGSKVLIFNGISLQNTFRVSATGGSVFDTANNTWTAMPAFQGHVNTQSAVAGTKIYIWGGELWSAGQFSTIPQLTNTGIIYDLATNTITAMPTAGAPSPRISAAVKWTGSKLLVLGGFSTAGLVDGAMYDPANGTWTAMNMAGAPPNPTGLAYRQAEIIDGKLYEFGSLTPATSGVFDPVQNKWSPLNLQEAPTARVNYGTLLDGSKFYVYGGQTNYATAPLDGGAVYNAATGLWTALEPAGAPAGSVRPSLYSTGSALGVIGGFLLPGVAAGNTTYAPNTGQGGLLY